MNGNEAAVAKMATAVPVTDDTVIAVRGLKKSYGKFQVLRGVGFTVRRGRVFALLGSNGAGKTTTVKILSTLMKPDGGSAEIDGLSVVREAERVRGRISLTGQYAAVDEVLTGRENLRMIGSLRRLPDPARRSVELLEMFGLTGAADRRVSSYSGGMRRKLDLAMSLMGNPSVIFLDEPTTGLDPQSRLSLWKTVRDLSRSGTTIFLTTQYLEEAERLADYIAVLNEGVIVAGGTAEELKKTLPGRITEFSFYDGAGMRAAAELLAGYGAVPDGEMLTVSVTTDDGVERLGGILNLLKAGRIPVARFEQKQPSLEDVFLSLIGRDAENPVKPGNKENHND